MDAVGLKERIENFDNTHGGLSSAILEDGWLLFPDGCSRERHPWGVQHTPSNPFERSKRIVKYWELRLQLTVEQFQFFRQQLLGKTKVAQAATFSPPPPRKEEIEKLKELQKKVLTCQKQLSKAKAAVEDSTPEQIRERRNVSELNRRENQAALSEINAIEV